MTVEATKAWAIFWHKAGQFAAYAFPDRGTCLAQIVSLERVVDDRAEAVPVRILRESEAAAMEKVVEAARIVLEDDICECDGCTIDKGLLNGLRAALAALDWATRVKVGSKEMRWSPCLVVGEPEEGA